MISLMQLLVLMCGLKMAFSEKKKLFSVGVAAVLWSIWKGHNLACFEKKWPSQLGVVLFREFCIGLMTGVFCRGRSLQNWGCSGAQNCWNKSRLRSFKQGGAERRGFPRWMMVLDLGSASGVG